MEKNEIYQKIAKYFKEHEKMPDYIKCSSDTYFTLVNELKNEIMYNELNSPNFNGIKIIHDIYLNEPFLLE